jgi:hypothetical protein
LSNLLDQRARQIVAHPAVTLRAPPAGRPAASDPEDLRALYAVCDGLALADGTRILGRAETGPATAWLKEERALSWDEALVVLGERDDLVILRDPDPGGRRAGGGVLEAPTDGLSAPARVALDVIGYLEDRLGIPGPAASTGAPEREAREAARRGDKEALARALARPFYPGAERDRAHAALALGALRAAAGNPGGALAAFAQAVEDRVRAAARGAEKTEARAAWKACAVAAERVGAADVAAACRARAKD